ncbi:MAG: hypothetical protein KAY65_02515 [Planctomycetes bacterium]|nr:hypothetical protein [Planctomycetota bacterium]
MLKAFDKKLRLVRLRCSINLLLRYTGRILTVAGVIAVLVLLAEYLLAMRVINPQSLWVFFGTAAALVVLLWLLNQPSRIQASLLLDERLKIHERFSTTLALADSKDPFADAARTEARETAERLDVQGHFPIKPSRCWFYAVSVWLVAGVLLLCPFQKDLLGFLKKQQQEDIETKQIEKAQAQIKEAATPVKLAVRQLGNPELAEALSKLGEIPKDAKPQDVKRQAIRALGDLSDQIKKMQSSAQLETAEMLLRMFKQLPGSADTFSQKLRQALAKGNFGEASNQLNQMRKQLEESNLSEEQRKAIAKQLQDLAKQLQQLAQKNEELEKELEKLGLDKKLAKMGDKQLREALQKQGLSGEKMEELLKKAAACRSAGSRCSELGQAMASCGAGAGGLSGDDLAAVMDQLDELAATKEQLAAMQASLNEISRCMGCLGEGMCEGLGEMGPFREGFAQRYGAGTGGPGMGHGPRGIDETGQTSTKKTNVKSKPGEGPNVASWYFKGTQVKGEAKREFSDVVQAARDSAAEAIDDSEIPRKYEDAVKSYFGRLEEAGE